MYLKLLRQRQLFEQTGLVQTDSYWKKDIWARGAQPRRRALAGHTGTTGASWGGGLSTGTLNLPHVRGFPWGFPVGAASPHTWSGWFRPQP